MYQSGNINIIDTSVLAFAPPTAKSMIIFGWFPVNLERGNDAFKSSPPAIQSINE